MSPVETVIDATVYSVALRKTENRNYGFSYRRLRFTVSVSGRMKVEKNATVSGSGRVLEGAVIDEPWRLAYCRSCGAEIVWGKTATGSVCPFDVVDGKPTLVTHFSTCPNAAQHSKRKA